MTNYSINKKAENYKKNEKNDSDEEGEAAESKENSSKWSYNQLKTKLISLGADWEKVDSEIKDVMIKTIIAVEPQIAHQMNAHTRHRNVCFELYGFDVLLDSKLKPWIIEVNVGPSLSSSSPFDKTLKTKLICDTLTLVGVRPYDRNADKVKTSSIYGRPPKLQFKSESEKVSSSYAKIYNISPKKTATSNFGGPIANGIDVSKHEDYEVLSEFLEQESRKGNYNRIFPLKENIEYYAQFFEYERYNNELIWEYISR